jgi:hypothetical protein
LNSLFLAADILAPESVLNQMQGKIDIIWTGSFLHLFNWETQLLAMKHILKLLKPNPDGLVVGRLMGNSTAGEYSHPSAPQKTMYRHDAQSFKKLFHAAADSFGEKWETDVLAAPFEDHMKITKLQEQTPEGTLSVKFVARKLARVDVATSHNFNF